MEEAVHEAYLIVNTFSKGETSSAPNPTHDFAALNGGCHFPHCLQSPSWLDDSLEGAMICLDDDVQVFRRSMSCGC